MREVNEAWQVLQDPVRRRAYDEQRLADARRRAAPSSSSSPRAAGGRTGPPVPARTDDDEDLVDVLPPMSGLTAGLFRHLPWVVLVVVFGVIFVLSAYAGGGDEGDADPQPAAVGDCIDVERGPTTTVVPCDGPHEYRVVERVTAMDRCPRDTEARRLAADGLFECVVPG